MIKPAIKGLIVQCLSCHTWHIGLEWQRIQYVIAHFAPLARSTNPYQLPAPLQPIVASRPWELVTVDILKIPQSAKGNQYILVAQDYFSKWPFAQSMPNQKAERIVKILRDQVFTLVGPLQQLHSDQG